MVIIYYFTVTLFSYNHNKGNKILLPLSLVKFSKNGCY